MELTRAIDAYCERMGPQIWAEPVNAITNLAFFAAAALLWRRSGRDGLARTLSAIVFAIGIGSGLFHTLAVVWTAIADVVPILCFILVYIYAINRHGWGLRPVWAFGLTVLFLPYAAITAPLFQLVPGLGGSAGYAPVPLLILIYATLLARRDAQLSRGLTLGAVLLIVSLTFRTLDLPTCGAVPFGTHFMWHILNAVMLGWMIEIYLQRRARQLSA